MRWFKKISKWEIWVSCHFKWSYKNHTIKKWQIFKVWDLDAQWLSRNYPKDFEEVNEPQKRHSGRLVKVMAWAVIWWVVTYAITVFTHTCS
jgi:hypothetical protein